MKEKRMKEESGGFVVFLPEPWKKRVFASVGLNI